MEQKSLFDDRDLNSPLASRLRPKTLEEVAGQKHLLGEGKILRQLIEQDQVSSMISGGRQAWAKRRWPGSSLSARSRISWISVRSPAGLRKSKKS